MRHKRRKQELLVRIVEVDSLGASFSILPTVGTPSESESQPGIELRGVLDSPLGDTRRATVTVYPRKPRETQGRAAGAVIAVKPELHAMFPLSERDFNWVASQALTGHLKFARLCFDKPRYGGALIRSVRFSSEQEE